MILHPKILFLELQSETKLMWYVTLHMIKIFGGLGCPLDNILEWLWHAWWGDRLAKFAFCAAGVMLERNFGVRWSLETTLEGFLNQFWSPWRELLMPLRRVIVCVAPCTFHIQTRHLASPLYLHIAFGFIKKRAFVYICYVSIARSVCPSKMFVSFLYHCNYCYLIAELLCIML